MTTVRLTAAHFIPVVGGGSDDVFVKSRKFMRGSGVFSSIANFLVPILKRLGGYALSRTADFAKDASTSLSQGRNLKESFRNAGNKTITRVGSDVLHKVQGGRVSKKQKIRNIFAKLPL